MSPPRRLLFASVNLLATVQVVWFYLTQVPSYLDLNQYEQGLASTPFQHRLLMVFPLRWAHHSDAIHRLAAHLSAMVSWFPKPVGPEDLIEFAIDLISVIITGLVARSLYRAASRSGLLTPTIYPLTLAMFASTYTFTTFHRLRFPYDLPSVAFFSLGMALVYFRRSQILFATVFILGTINRETTLFLLVLLPLRESIFLPLQKSIFVAFRSTSRPRLVRLRTLLRTCWIVLPLSLLWIAWHQWVVSRFGGNQSEAGPRLLLNIGTFLWPFSWPQLLGVFAFCLPPLLVYRRRVPDRTLRRWQAVLPLWFAFMLYFGLYVETRIFGELIAFIAASIGLILESLIEQRFRSSEAPAFEKQESICQAPQELTLK